jgi:hypothetical protein
MRAWKFAAWIALLVFATSTSALAGDHKLTTVAAETADALATNDGELLKRHLLTYEEGASLSDKFTRQTKKEYTAERDTTIAETWREVREAKIMVDHVEVEEVVIQSVSSAVPPKYYTIAVAMPVLIHEKREIRSPLLRLFFVQIDGKWKYAHQQ